jgi:hypothetical protein
LIAVNRRRLRFARACAYIRGMDIKLWTKAFKEAERELELRGRAAR